MRRLSLLLALAPMSVGAQAGDWQLLANSPTHSYRFEDASFLDPSHGWIVDGSGRTYRTVDAGASWQLMSTVPGVYHRSTAFVSATHGWVGTLFSSQRLLETHDAGATVVDVTARISPAVPGGICGMWAVNADTAFAAGQYAGPAYVIRTTDGGVTWQSQSLSHLAGSLIDIVFVDGQRGFAVGGTLAYTDAGGQVVVLATEDAGQTWERRFVGSMPAAGDGEWGWKISFPTPDVGYVSVERRGSPNAKVLKTTDGGQTWAELTFPAGGSPQGSLQGVGFLTPLRGWASGRGVTMATVDGGLTWAPAGTVDGYVNRFEFFGDTLGYAMGRRIYALDARTTTASDRPPGTPRAGLEPVAPNPATDRAVLRFRLDGAAEVALEVFDVLGRRVAALADGLRVSGVHEVWWDGRTESGAPAPPGVYVARLRAGGAVYARAFTVAR